MSVLTYRGVIEGSCLQGWVGCCGLPTLRSQGAFCWTSSHAPYLAAVRVGRKSAPGDGEGPATSQFPGPEALQGVARPAACCVP